METNTRLVIKNALLTQRRGMGEILGHFIDCKESVRGKLLLL